jgi:hypothetical protein
MSCQVLLAKTLLLAEHAALRVFGCFYSPQRFSLGLTLALARLREALAVKLVALAIRPALLVCEHTTGLTGLALNLSELINDII